MPWMMMFIMAPFAAGLLIYWITSNVLTHRPAEVPLCPSSAAQGARPTSEAADHKRAAGADIDPVSDEHDLLPNRPPPVRGQVDSAFGP